MSKKEKTMILVLLLILVVAIVAIVVLRNPEAETKTGEQGANEEKYTTTLEDGTKLNTSSDFNATKKYNNLEISNMQFTEKDGMSVMLADVKNIGTEKHEQESVNIVVLDDNDEQIATFRAIIEDIEPGQSAKINATISASVANAKDYRIEAIK